MFRIYVRHDLILRSVEEFRIFKDLKIENLTTIMKYVVRWNLANLLKSKNDSRFRGCGDDSISERCHPAIT